MAIQIMTGDARARLADMPDESVHCCVTSPPYFGLRDYGTAQWEGGYPDCDHKRGTARQDGGRTKIDGFNGSSRKDSDKGAMNYRMICAKCGATRTDNQIGLEATPDAYVAELVAVFREVRRVLRKDGTLWLNLGDSYAASGGGGEGRMIELYGQDSSRTTGIHSAAGRGQQSGGRGLRLLGLKTKDLIGIPWMVAFALRADGWYLRSDIIWAKPNPMPESVTDRPTSAHEHVFLLSKSPRYWYDAEAVREPIKPGTTGECSVVERQGGTSFNENGQPYGARRKYDEIKGANCRNVWNIATRPYPEAHFATFPPALVEPCIKAGCPEGGTVLDPFGGSGTTGLVADRLQRNAVLIELNPEYAEMAEARIYRDAPMFAEVMRP